MNVCLAVNKKYAYPALVAIYSFLKNNKKESHNIYLFYSEKMDDELSEINEIVENLGSKFCPVFVSDDMFKDFSIGQYWSKEAFYRFLIPEFLGDADRALYLDADIIVDKDVSEFYYQSFDGNLFCAVTDLNEYNQIYKRLTFLSDKRYFCSGVMLFNIKGLKESGYSKQFIKEEYAKYKDYLEYFDQDLLNIVYNGKVKFCDKKYDYMISIKDPKNRKICKYVLENVAIIHYIWAKKPWQLQYMDAIGRLWNKYAKQIVLKDGTSLLKKFKRCNPFVWTYECIWNNFRCLIKPVYKKILSLKNGK